MRRTVACVFVVMAVGCNDDSSHKTADDLSVSDGPTDLGDDQGLDLSEADLSTSDLVPPVCTDSDGDGHSPVPGCPFDCDDNDPNVWSSCATCQDGDGDKHFAGCDAYVTLRADCDDGTTAVTSHPEVLGDGIDQDCDGIDGPSGDDPRILYASVTTGDDANPGTRALPVQTLDHAVQLALASKVGSIALRRFIFLAAGDYSYGSATLTGGVSLYGGFDASTWASSGGTTTLNITDETGIHVNSGDDGVTFQKLTLLGATGSTQSFGIQASGACTVVDSLITAAGGASMMFSTAVSSTSQLTLSGSTLSAGPADFVDCVSGSGGRTITGGSITATGHPAMVGGRAHAIAYGGTTDHLALSGVALHASDSLSVTGLDIRLAGLPVVDLTNNTIDVAEGGAAGGSVTAVSGYGTKHTAIGNAINVTATSGGRGYFVATQQRSAMIDNAVRVSGASGIGIFISTVGADLVNNSVHVNAGTGVQVSADSTTLYNNLLVLATSGTTLLLQSPNTNATINLVDNALSLNTGCAFSSAGTCVAGTINDCSWSACQSSSGNLTSDCGITSTDFHISAGSNCQSAGADPIAVYPSPFPDIDHVTRPQGSWDIGADEIPN